MDENFYNLLKVPLDATPEEIREAYFNAAKLFHPDVNPDKDTQKEFIRIQQAYESLSVPAKRMEYDTYFNLNVTEQTSINLNTLFSRTAIPPLSEQQLFYALFELECRQKVDVNSLPPIHFCLIVDHSSSMRGERTDMVRSNIVQLLGKMRPNDLISIVSFSDRAKIVIPPTRTANIRDVVEQLEKIIPSGATEIFQGLEAGYQLIDQPGQNVFFKNLILITDGHTYGDEISCLDLAAKAWANGVATSCMGIGHEWNDAFLDQLSAVGGGSCVYVQKSEDLLNYLDSKLGSMKVGYAKKLELNFAPIKGVEVMDVFRIFPDEAPLKIEPPIPLGSLEYGNKTVFIIEFKIDPLLTDVQNVCLMDGKLTMEIPSNPVTQARNRITWCFRVDEASLSDKPPVNIVHALSRLTLYRLLKRANDEVFGGNYTQATKHLQHLATHLLSQGNRELARAVLIEADHIQRTHQFSKEGEKRIKYGTRALLNLPIPEQVIK